MLYETGQSVEVGDVVLYGGSDGQTHRARVEAVDERGVTVRVGYSYVACWGSMNGATLIDRAGVAA